MEDDEDAKFREEQFILRVPEELADEIRDRIIRDDFNDFELEFPGDVHEPRKSLRDVDLPTMAPKHAQ